MVPMASPVVHTDTTGDLRFRAFKKPIMGGMNITSTMKTNPNELLIHDSVCRSFDFYTQKIKKSLKDRGVWWTVILVLEIYAKTQILFPKDIKVKHKEELQKIRNKTNKIITLLLNQLKQAAATEKTHVPARLDPTAKGFSETRTLAAIASAIILLLENSILTSSYWQYIVHIAGLFQLTIVPTIDVVTMEPSTCYPHYFALNVTDLISADTINTYSRPILGSISAISSSSSSGDALTRSDATPETHDVKAQKMSLMYNPYLDQGHPINGDDYDFSTISYNLTPDWLKFTNIPSANPADPAVKKGKVGQTGGSGSKQPVDNSYLINAITKENYFELLNRDKMLRFKDTLRYDMCPGTTIVVGTPATDEQKKQFARFAKNLGVCYGGIIHGVSQIIDCQAKVVCTDYSLTYSVPIPFVDSLAAGDAWAIHWVHELYNEPFFPRTCFNNNQNNYFAQKKHPIFGLNNVFIWRNLMK
jgi:hypothetical protein